MLFIATRYFVVLCQIVKIPHFDILTCAKSARINTNIRSGIDPKHQTVIGNMMSTKNSFQTYLTSWAGSRLFKEYSPDEYGIWEIYGEDPNCDMGGSHIEPLLETVEGRLEDVVQYGVTLPRFWQWGSGGRFKLIKTTGFRKITPEFVASLDTREERRKEIKDQIAELQRKLDQI